MPTDTSIRFLIESLKAWAIATMRDDPELWASIPSGPVSPKVATFEQNCQWAIKQYMLDDPATRDLPYRGHW
jgi:hypothetical protein